MSKPLTKNARKRIARKAYAESQSNGGVAQAIPYSFKITTTRDGKSRTLTFASLTSYKKHLKENHAQSMATQESLERKASLDPVTIRASQSRADSASIGLKDRGTKSKPRLRISGDVNVKGSLARRLAHSGRFYRDNQTAIPRIQNPHDVTQSAIDKTAQRESAAFEARLAKQLTALDSWFYARRFIRR